MKNGDFYKHYKGGEYFFDCIALPLNGKRFVRHGGTARYHEDTHDLKLFFDGGITYIDSELPHIIYQAEKDYDTGFVYAREVDDFFGYVNTSFGFEKRFNLIKQ